MSLENIKTVVLLMFENRSFDNMLGHLSYERLQPVANGLLPPANQNVYANYYEGGVYYPFACPEDQQLEFDVPHEYNFVATQLAPGPDQNPTMTGFVQAYADATGTNPDIQCDTMAFYGSSQVPVTSFLARTFCICDNWFCPLPSSTQPNRTIAFCGHSEIYETKLQDIPAAGNIFEWLEANKISWGVYCDGFTFFALYLGIWRWIFSGNFHPYEQLARDLKNGTQPQVIIVEPSYQDAPHVGPDHPNDNHPPIAVGWGEDFLRRTYQAVTMNPKVWAETLMVDYYDEHGGFYDHVIPPEFNNAGAGNVPPPAPYAFNTLGPRIPAILVSPWVTPGTVRKELYDHTSVLQLLADLFKKPPYSAQVQYRAEYGITNLKTALADTASNLVAPPPPADPIFVTSQLGKNIATLPEGNMAKAFEAAAIDMLNRAPDQVDEYFPDLNLWKRAIDQTRSGA